MKSPKKELKIIIIHENEIRKIIKIKDLLTGKSEYYWIDSKGLITNEAQYQKPETRLELSKEELQELFPDVFINLAQKRVWNNFKGTHLIVPKKK